MFNLFLSLVLFRFLCFSRSAVVAVAAAAALTKSSDCKPQQITAIGNRLLDWFSVIMADSRKQKQHLPKSKSNFQNIIIFRFGRQRALHM